MKQTLLYVTALFSMLCGFQRSQAQCVPVVTTTSIILCPNESDTLWADVHDTYQWLKDGLPVSGATNQYHVVDNNDIGSIFDVITTTTGCAGQDTSVDSVYIDGWAFLLPFVINITDNQLCGNADTVIFDFSLDSAVQWYVNGAPIPGANNDTLIVTTPGAYTAEGAPDVCPNFIMTLGLNLDVVHVPQPDINPDSLMLCDGVFGTIATALSSYDSFQWYFNGAPLTNSNSSSISTQNQGSYYVVTFTETFGQDCMLTSDTSYVDTASSITPVITQVGNTLVSVPGGSQLSNFQWYLNGTPINGATDSTYIPTAAGNYTVSASNGNCTDTSAAYVFTLSVKALNSTIAYSVYPNPAQSEIHINSATAVSVMLLDNLGRIVYTGKANKTHRIDVEKLSAGVYTIKLGSDEATVCEKIIVE